MHRDIVKCLSLWILLSLLSARVQLDAQVPYQIDLQGVKCETVKELIIASSQLYNLQNTPPTTRLGLKKRTESDIANIITALHSQAYWGAKVVESYDFEKSPAVVTLQVEEGPVYPFSKLILYEVNEKTCLEISPEYFGIVYGQPSLPAKIRAAEEGLIAYFHDLGYPYPSLEATDVIADQATESVIVKVSIKKGPQMVFGDVFIEGNECVKKAYFFKHLAWSRGEMYCPRKIRATRRDLERSGLFTYVEIFYDETPKEEERILPINISVKEGKNRTIGLGGNFQTQRGLGFTGEWEHRNFQGMGEVLTLKTNLWSDKQVGRLSYLQPDLYCKGEDLLWLYEFNREVTEGYTTKSLSAFTRIEKQMGKKLKISYGVGFKHLRDTHIHEKKNHQKQKTRTEEFNLLKTPLSAFYNSTDDLLDPHKGMTFRFSTAPSVSISSPIFFYSINTLVFTYYRPLWKDFTIFAFRTTLGSIFGAPKTTIPRSELFDAGGDTLLRGYHYKTVSPLDDDHDPTGGRSMLISSFEIRTRWTKNFGSVLFFDIGNVYSCTLPSLKEKMLSSVGIGIRYYTAVAPIRLDVAIPLTPRRHVDNQHYQIYFSVGQAF